MLKRVPAAIFVLALPLLCGTVLGADVYPADAEYPVRICGRFRAASDGLYLEARQSFGDGSVEFLLVPRRLRAGSPDGEYTLEQSGANEISRVTTLTTQVSPIAVFGCAYSGRVPIMGEKPKLLIEKLIAKKDS